MFELRSFVDARPDSEPRSYPQPAAALLTLLDHVERQLPLDRRAAFYAELAARGREFLALSSPPADPVPSGCVRLDIAPGVDIVGRPGCDPADAEALAATCRAILSEGNPAPEAL